MATSGQTRSAPAARRIADTLRTALAPARVVGFWSAVVLPLALVPMLMSGFANTHPRLFAGLLLANLVAAAAGRGYDQD